MIKTLKEIIKNSLSKVQDDVSKKDILYLIKETFSLDESDLFLKEESLFDDNLLNSRMKKYLEGMPVEYILGYCFFAGLKLHVNQSCLIPRSETEELVLYSKAYLKKYYQNMVIFEVGSGSGNIALSLKKDFPQARIISGDISSSATEIAQRNGKENHLDVEFVHSDCLSYLIENHLQVDVIISNPPYIDVDNYVQDSVLKYEPHSALFAENHGLAIYEKILEDAHLILKEHFLMAFEISDEQEDALTLLIKKYFPQAKYEFKKDLNHFTRFLFIEA